MQTLHLRRFISAIVLSCFALGSAGAQQKFDYGHSATSDVAIMLVGGYAKLRITGWARDSVSISGALPKGFRLEPMFGSDASQPARGAKMYIAASDKMAPPGGTIELRVPFNARVTTRAGIADIEATGMLGGLDVNVTGGSVRVTGNARSLKVESIDGSITLDGTPDWVRLNTAEGDITVRGGSPDASFTTVSGNIRVSDGSIEHARFETVTGSVTYAGDLVRGADVRVDTHSGAIDLQFGLKASATFEAVSTNGTIENLWHSGKPTTSRDGRGQEISMQMGAGEGHVVVRTLKGSVRLSKRM